MQRLSIVFTIFDDERLIVYIVKQNNKYIVVIPTLNSERRRKYDQWRYFLLKKCYLKWNNIYKSQSQMILFKTRTYMLIYIYEREIIYYHQFTKVNASEPRRTGAKNSAGRFFRSIIQKHI